MLVEQLEVEATGCFLAAKAHPLACLPQWALKARLRTVLLAQAIQPMAKPKNVNHWQPESGKV
jgi:hypothetical protein